MQVQNNVQNQLGSTFYKQTQIKFDFQRDMMQAGLDKELETGAITDLEFEEGKNESRWDFAWQIFDEINLEI